MEIATTPVNRKRKNYYDTESPPIVLTPKRIRWQLSKENSSPSKTNTVSQLLPDLLQALEKEQLISIISNLVSANPNLENSITELLPRPTLSNTTTILSNMAKKVFDQMPYSKFGPDRSDYSFNRVRPVLEELQKSIIQFLDFFTLPQSYPASLEHEYAGDAFGYLHMATSLVHKLPIWNTESNNEFKDYIYERLGRHWRIVVSEISKKVNEEGKVYGSHIVGEWIHILSLHCTEINCRFGFKEALDELKRNLGWIVGLNNEQDLLKNQFVPFGMASGYPSVNHTFGNF